MENRRTGIRQATITTILCLTVLTYMLAPRPQPTTNTTIYDHPPRHLITDVQPALNLQPALNVKPALNVQDYARSLTGSGEAWECLNKLWWHESKWDYQAESPTNDWGIPQANADAHPETSQERWRADEYEQVRWGVQYIQTRYGGFCEAWGAWTSRATQLADGGWHGGWY